MKEYIYRDKKTGEYYISTEPVENPELELVAVYEYGRRRTTNTAGT